MNFLKNFLRGPARPAEKRPVPMVPVAKHPARSQAVEVLELRVQQSIRRSPVVPVEYETSPAQRAGLMPVGRMRQAEENEAAQLKRELVMERMRVKELREQLEEAQKNRSTQALVGMLEGVSAEAKCMELQAELREVRRQLEELRVRGSVMLEAVEKPQPPLLQRVREFKARREAREVVPELQPQHAEEKRWWADVFADESSKLTFLEVIGGKFERGVIVIEGPPASGKTRLGEVLAGEGTAQQMEDERGVQFLIASNMGRPLFFDDISTCQPWYQGPALHASGTPLHSEAILEALKNEKQVVVLAGPHIDLSLKMEAWAIRIRLKGGAL